MKFIVGTSGFSYKAWRGKFYPAKMAPDAMLAYYAERFNAVEINGSFYRMPDPVVLNEWAQTVPPEFHFAFKAPGAITHRKWTAATPEVVKQFTDATAVLGARLGPLLFQFPPYLKKDEAMLSRLIQSFPVKCQVAFEFRHPSWFDEAIFALLKTRRAPLVYNDADVDAMPFVATADNGYLRLRQPHYTDADLLRLHAQCQAQEWKHTYVFFKHEDEATGPALALRWNALTSPHLSIAEATQNL